MLKMAMSAAAAGLLRALLARAGGGRDQILLTDVKSVDWQSLTFTGERHEIALRIIGSQASQIFHSIADGLAEAEFHIPGQIVADVVMSKTIADAADGSVAARIEALTIAE